MQQIFFSLNKTECEREGENNRERKRGEGRGLHVTLFTFKNMLITPMMVVMVLLALLALSQPRGNIYFADDGNAKCTYNENVLVVAVILNCLFN